jgi:hypothetical protein
MLHGGWWLEIIKETHAITQARMTRNPDLEGLHRCQSLPPGSGLLNMAWPLQLCGEEPVRWSWWSWWSAPFLKGRTAPLLRIL